MIALVCIVMVTFMSAALACHTHAEASSLRQGSHPSHPSPEDHCLVCVAMHTALPSPLHFAPTLIFEVETLTLVASDARRPFGWRFEMAGRGPPVALSDSSLLN